MEGPRAPTAGTGSLSCRKDATRPLHAALKNCIPAPDSISRGSNESFEVQGFPVSVNCADGSLFSHREHMYQVQAIQCRSEDFGGWDKPML